MSTQQPESLVTIYDLEHPMFITRRIRPCLARIRLDFQLAPRQIRRSKTKPVGAGDVAKFDAPLAAEGCHPDDWRKAENFLQVLSGSWRPRDMPGRCRHTP